LGIAALLGLAALATVVFSELAIVLVNWLATLEVPPRRCRGWTCPRAFPPTAARWWWCPA
ncbi:hypothetical protein HH297_13470, partial [Xanthomonas sp. Kuri4-3]